MTEHEKRIREALCLADQDEELITVVASRHLRALLADLDRLRDNLDAMRGALEGAQSLIRRHKESIRKDLDCGEQEEATEVMRQIRAALSEAKAGGWLPIETAPKDGRRVLVWIDDKHLARENRQINFAKLWFYEDGRLGGGAEGFNGEWNITHWQPLPNPPKGEV